VTDTRELILSQLLTIAKKVTPAAKRMEFGASSDDNPALMLIDGEESILSSDPFAHQSEYTHKIQMDPHFVLMLQTSERAGPLMNKIRAQLVKAVLSDETLKNLTGNQSGSTKVGARYMGCETGVQMGEGLVGVMTLRFSLIYVMKPSNL